MILLVSIVEFLENNPTIIIVALLNIIATVVWFIRQEMMVKSNTTDIKELQSNYISHVANGELHVNQPYIGTLRDRIEKLETTVEVGHRLIEEKIDKRFDTLMGQLKRQ